MTEAPGIWVYAVGRAADPGGVPGINGRAVHCIEADGLTAVASDVTLDEFGESALPANLENLAWLEATATAHHRVIDEVARAQPLVPMRLATVFTTEAGVKAMLHARGAELRDLLDRIGQRREWGVKAFAAAPAERDELARATSGSPASAGSGAAYLQRRRAELVADRNGKQEAARCAAQVHAELTSLAADTRLHPPQVPQLAGTKATMLLNAAYLLDDATLPPFRATLRQLARQNQAIELQLTGPWPPYSFASLEETREGFV